MPIGVQIALCLHRFVQKTPGVIVLLRLSPTCLFALEIGLKILPFSGSLPYLILLSPVARSLSLLASMLGPLLKSSSTHRAFLDFAGT
jgi:hypothetical protein